MDRVCIRMVEAADTSDILDIYAPYVLGTTVSFEYEVPEPAAFGQRIASIAGTWPWLVCEVDGKLAAYAYASRHMERAAYAWDTQSSVYVAPRYQGLGLGRVLYACLFELLRAMGYVNVYTIVALPDRGSLGFHTALGFSLIGTFLRTGYKFGTWLDAAWLAKTLMEPPDVPAVPKLVSALDAGFVAELCARHATPCLRSAFRLQHTTPSPARAADEF